MITVLTGWLLMGLVILCVDHVAGLVITVLTGWLLMGLVILKY